jgi:uncharacterized protein (TIGR02421 family)
VPWERSEDEDEMAARSKAKPSEKLLDDIAQRVEQGVHVRRALPPDGRVHIDRQLPFLIVYRPPPGSSDPALRSLVASQASYVIAPTDRSWRSFTLKLVERIARLQSGVFGGFLLVELWVQPDAGDTDTVADDIRPDFEVAIPRQLVDTPSVNALVSGLAKVRILGHKANVLVRPSVPLAPQDERRLLPIAVAKETNTHAVGVATYAAWRSSETGEPYPLVRRAIVHQVSRSLAQAAFVFAREETSSRPLHYQALGRRAVVRAVRQVDHQLADVAESFDLLLTVTPVNADAAYRSFRRSGYARPPRFQYRPHTVDPSLLKRRLFDIKIERVEDPTLEALFREKRRELELKLSLIGDRLTERFLPTSVALYGKVDDDSVALARTVLTRLEPSKASNRSKKVSGSEFAAVAEIELATYRAMDSSITPSVDLRDDVSSLMVSAGSLLVGRAMSIPADRVNALIQHEIGTHVVTYWNGRSQPFRLLASGLARHDELQEGLAVFAEYIVGGLTPARLRILAARVVAARAVADGAEFIDTYRLLLDEVGLSSRSAFMVAMRVHRGGGLVKDAVYLRGLQGVVDYVHKGGRLDTLLVGKMATEHTAVIEELQRREVLHSPTLRPNFLNGPDSHYRIERVREGLDLAELVDWT